MRLILFYSLITSIYAMDLDCEMRDPLLPHLKANIDFIDFVVIGYIQKQS